MMCGVATWQQDAAHAARIAGVDPALFQALVYQESRGDPNAVSKAGALGYTQLMPATAAGLGVDPRNPQQNLLGGAKYLAQQLKAFGGNTSKALAAYNAGPGAVQKYGGIPPFGETQAYVKNVQALTKRYGGGAAADPSGAAGVDAVRAVASSSPAPAASALADVGASANGAQVLAGLLSGQGQQRPVSSGSALQAPSFAAKPVLGGAVAASSGGPAPRADIGALISAAQTPGQAAATQLAAASSLVADASSPTAASGGGSGASAGSGGAQAALGWAQSKVGFRETGENAGGLAGYLNQRFGMANAPWCAMFTSAAVTKGGAPAVARTASVAEVRRQAVAGGLGYQKGFVDPKAAHEGDLILFGDDHIAMVQRVAKGKVYYVGGNQSNGVTESSVPVGRGDIVRPKYGAR